MLPVTATESVPTLPPAPGSGGLQLAHLSDPHLSHLRGVAWQSLLNKRILGYLSWRRRRRQEHQPRVLAALGRDLRENPPDHIVVTGDLTHVGLPEEYRQVARWLRELGSSERVTVIPGNHDAYVSTPVHQTLRHWQPYLRGEVLTGPQAASTPDCFPAIRLRGDLALVSLNSAVPSAPLFATGTVGRTQLAALERILPWLAEAGYYSVVLVHHSPVRGSISWRKRLTDAQPLAALLRRHRRVVLVLHGHSHRTEIGWLPTASGRALVCGVPSASAEPSVARHGAAYHRYHVSSHNGRLQIRLHAHRYDGGRDAFVSGGEARHFQLD
jgi:3',5'-cyclic AMP phosphodiesterase CpdA